MFIVYISNLYDIVYSQTIVFLLDEGQQRQADHTAEGQDVVQPGGPNTCSVISK